MGKLLGLSVDFVKLPPVSVGWSVVQPVTSSIFLPFILLSQPVILFLSFPPFLIGSLVPLHLKDLNASPFQVL